MLLTWELGANLGHLKPLLAIGRSLAEEGAEIALAARDLSDVDALGSPGLTILQAPVWPTFRLRGVEQDRTGYTDILAAVGFAEPSLLAPLVAAWDGLLDLWKPDLVIADHCPALMVALYSRPIARLAIGTGYTMPPLHHARFVQHRADLAPLMPDEYLLASAAKVLERRGIVPPPTLTALFRSPRLVFSLPELDPYLAHRKEPLYLPPEGVPLLTPPPAQPHLFVYLGNDLPTLAPVAEALSRLKMRLSTYLRGVTGPIPLFLKQRGVTVHETPPDLRDLLPRTSHAFSLGGVHFCQAVLAAGRPHLIYPLHAETALNQAAVSRLQAAWRLQSIDNATLIADTLTSFVKDLRLPRDAQQAGRQVAAHELPDGIKALKAWLTDWRGAKPKGKPRKPKHPANTSPAV